MKKINIAQVILGVFLLCIVFLFGVILGQSSKNKCPETNPYRDIDFPTIFIQTISLPKDDNCHTTMDCVNNYSLKGCFHQNCNVCCGNEYSRSCTLMMCGWEDDR